MRFKLDLYRYPRKRHIPLCGMRSLVRYPVRSHSRSLSGRSPFSNSLLSGLPSRKTTFSCFSLVTSYATGRYSIKFSRVGYRAGTLWQLICLILIGKRYPRKRQIPQAECGVLCVCPSVRIVVQRRGAEPLLELIALRTSVTKNNSQLFFARHLLRYGQV